MTTYVKTNLSDTNPVKSWLPDSVWCSICSLASSSVGILATLPKSIEDYSKEWKKYYIAFLQQGSIGSKSVSLPELPTEFTNLSEFEKLCLSKALNPEKFVFQIKNYVSKTIGDKFLYYPPFDLERAFRNSLTSTPMIFVLPGTDPMATLRTFAQTKNKAEESLCLMQQEL